MQAIEDQIKDNINKAFFDLIDQNINSKNPDYEWITKLYEEIKFRLLSFLPNKKGNVYKQLDDEFDVELFKQMIENDVFNQESMIKLINNTFQWILDLQAPIRDSNTIAAKNRVLNAESTKIISTYLKEVHNCIGQIEDDILAFKNSK